MAKPPIPALAETSGFLLVEALPQSPQNTEVVFWKGLFNSSLLLVVPVTGLDCISRFAGNHGGSRFLNWLPEMSTGHFHLGGFEFGAFISKKAPRLGRCS